MPTWAELIEHGLSLAGLIAIMAWAYKWISKFSSKQRELSDIDREIRQTLREALDTQRTSVDWIALPMKSNSNLCVTGLRRLPEWSKRRSNG